MTYSNDDKLPEQVGKLAEKVEKLNTTIGKVANVLQGLSLYDNMEKDDREILTQVRMDFSALNAKVSEWMVGTTEYRKLQKESLDKLTDILVKLPCKERSGWYLAINRQIGIMWVFIGGIVLAVVTEFFRLFR